MGLHPGPVDIWGWITLVGSVGRVSYPLEGVSGIYPLNASSPHLSSRDNQKYLPVPRGEPLTSDENKTTNAKKCGCFSDPNSYSPGRKK